MARAMGAAVNDNLSRMTTHLVCATVKGAKYDATMHSPLRGQIYLVTPEYVRCCHTTIARLDERKYPTLPGSQHLQHQEVDSLKFSSLSVE